MGWETVKRFSWLVLGGVLVGACMTVPHTGRSQLSLVSDAEIIRSADQQFGAYLGSALRRGAVLSADESPDSAAIIARVRRVANEVVDAAGVRGSLAWDVTVIKDARRNAFVLPNGKIVVYTGILPVAEDDAGLATVLGHEVGHVVGRHSAE